MSGDSTARSDSDRTDERTRATETERGSDTEGEQWGQDVIGDVIGRINHELASLEHEASGTKATAIERGRELIEEIEGVLRDAAEGEPPSESTTAGFEEYETVDVSEARKRP